MMSAKTQSSVGCTEPLYVCMFHKHKYISIHICRSHNVTALDHTSKTFLCVIAGIRPSSWYIRAGHSGARP